MAIATAVKPTRKGQGKGDHFVELSPHAGRVLQAMRHLGYSSLAAVLDIVDNAVDAGADSVVVSITANTDNRVTSIEVQDNGRGMDADTLTEALRLGSGVDYRKSSLGKYGMGLKSATLSFARNLWVITRRKGKPAFEGTFDLDAQEAKKQFGAFIHEATGAATLKYLGDVEQGTIIRISKIDKIDDTNAARFGKSLRDELGRVHRFAIDRGVTFRVNKHKVDKADPLMWDNPQTQHLFDSGINLGAGKRAQLRIVELPDFGSGQANEDAGITGRNAGFYIVRNGREIAAAQKFDFPGLGHHSYAGFRAELAFDASLDDVMKVDVMKSTVKPDDKLRDTLYAQVEKFIKQAGSRSREAARPITLTPKSVEDAINIAILGPAPAPKVEQVKENEKPTPAAKLDVVEQDKTAVRKAVEFVTEDAGPSGRFYTAEETSTCPLLIKLNRQHPLVRAVEGKSKPGTILAYLVTALARAEREVQGGHKFVERVCSELTKLLPE